MKKIKTLSVIMMLLTTFISGILTSCTKNENYIVDGSGSLVTVQLTVKDTISLSKIVPVLNDNNQHSTRASIHTRADDGTIDDFVPVIPNKYIAYFVAAEDKDSYKTGDIVKIISVNPGNNSITVPDIKYNIYVTNYNNKLSTENDLIDIQTKLPDASDSLYLSGDTTGVKFNNVNGGKISVSLKNLYAAVAVRNNDLTDGVTFAKDILKPIPYVLDTSKKWYYLYIKCPASVTTKTNSTITLKNCGSLTSYPLNEDIQADHKYEFTLNHKEGGGLYIDVSNIFKATPITYIIDLSF